MARKLKSLLFTTALLAGMTWGAVALPQYSTANEDSTTDEEASPFLLQEEEASWYDCRTRELWSPAKQVWCDNLTTVQNLEYNLPGYGILALEDGRFENWEQRVQVVLPSEYGWVVFDDLDGDGRDDAVVLLGVNSGGSGQFTYLTPVLNVAESPEPLAPVFLGDRVQIQDIAIVNQKVIVNLITHDDDDPLCCPTLETTWRYSLQPTLVPLDEAAATPMPLPDLLPQNPPATSAPPPEQTMSTPSESVAEVTGTVTYLPRIALPPDAIVEVSLQDVSRADAPAITLASQTIELNGRQVPVDFALSHNPNQMEPGHTYAVRASIRVGEELWFTSTRSYPIIPGEHHSAVEILVDRVVGRSGR